ncbi:MAG: peptidylprolyl isomerase [bacterium]
MIRRISCILIAMIFWAWCVSAVEMSPQKIAATVDGAGITEAQLQSEMNRLMPQTFFHQGVDEEKKNVLRQEALKNLIEKELKYQEAVRLGLEVKKKVLKKELNKVIASYPSQKAFDERLKAGHFTRDDVIQEIRRNKLVELVYQNEVVEKVQVTEEQARVFYEKNKEKFVQPVQFHLMDILLKVPPLADDFEKKTLRDKGEAIVKKMHEGLTFDDAVAQYSEGPDKEKGGDMGFMHKGRLAPEIEKAVMELKPGEIAGPFETFKGFYIFRLEAILPERLSPFAEVQEKLTADLTDQAVLERENSWLKELKSKAKIVVVEGPNHENEKPMEK